MLEKSIHLLYEYLLSRKSKLNRLVYYKENSPTGKPLGEDRGVVVLSLLQSSSQSQ